MSGKECLDDISRHIFKVIFCDITIFDANYVNERFNHSELEGQTFHEIRFSVLIVK